MEGVPQPGLLLQHRTNHLVTLPTCDLQKESPAEADMRLHCQILTYYCLPQVETEQMYPTCAPVAETFSATE